MRLLKKLLDRRPARSDEDDSADRLEEAIRQQTAAERRLKLVEARVGLLQRDR